MNNKKIASLMQKANRVLTESGILRSNLTIEDSYNGQIAGLGVSIAMSGLLPSLAIYYHEASDSRTVDRRKILEAVGRMIALDIQFTAVDGISNAETLFRKAMSANESSAKLLKQEVLDCAIALKQVVRTYKLV